MRKKIGEIIAYWFIPTSGSVLDVVKASDLKEWSDQDTDSNVV